MKIIISIVVLVIVTLATQSLKAQQLPLYSQYMLNGFLMNPAQAGSVDYRPLRLTARQQWTGIDDAPSTVAISGHSMLKNNKVGVGGYIYNDKFGPVSQTGIQASFAYHLNLNKNNSKLAFGLAVSAAQYSMDQRNFNLQVSDPTDQSVTGAKESSFIPDANFGMYLYNGKYFVGLSAAQLVQWKINVGTEGNNQLVRHYFVTAGYKFDLEKTIKGLEFEPSILVKATESSPIQFDVNTKLYYKRNYWLGVSYRHQDAVIAMIGFKINQYFIGYAYDYTLSNIMNYSSGSHEIMIGINLGEFANKGSSLL